MPEQTLDQLEQPAHASHDQGLSPSLSVAGNSLQLFTESPPLFASMLADIQKARTRVWLESYIFLPDRAGEAFAAALKAKAHQGLDVRVMYDAVGSHSAPEAFFESMRQAGVQVHAFHTVGEALRRLSFLRVLNRRDHRKTLVVDDRIAYFGGMNIVDQTQAARVEEEKAAGIPASAGWRDVHARLEGPKQPEVAAAFERLWERAHSGPRRRWPHWPVQKMLMERNEGIYFFASRPGLPFRTPLRVFLPLIRRARRSITLSMAYFVPHNKLLKALFQARRRGVTVRLVVPAKNDIRLVQWATRHLYRRLLKNHIEVFERQNLMLHSKVTVIDGELTVVGSCNMDARSLRWNLEFFSVVRSGALAEEVEKICAYEIAHSRRVDLNDCQGRRWWQCLLDRGAYALRRWL